jgi:hypothetical protein
MPVEGARAYIGLHWVKNRAALFMKALACAWDRITERFLGNTAGCFRGIPICLHLEGATFA